MITSELYLDALKKAAYAMISTDINNSTFKQIVEDLYNCHLLDKKSKSFQAYYFSILNDEKKLFFKDFKKQYALQGIDNKYLELLELNKDSIIEQIRTNQLLTLYFDTFRKAKIKYRDTDKEKDLGSFFAKLVHTFRPDEYCALDNPIKNHFGLSKESFFIAFLVLSDVYSKWSADNRFIIKSIRDKFKLLDKDNIINHAKMTNHKLLDLIFWSKANKPL